MTEQQQSILRKAAHDLGEHFDTIQIFVTIHQPAEVGGTMHGSLGVGNWYARYGQIREWLIRTDEDAKCSVRHERSNGDSSSEED